MHVMLFLAIHFRFNLFSTIQVVKTFDILKFNIPTTIQVVRPLEFGVDLVMHSCTKVGFLTLSSATLMNNKCAPFKNYNINKNDEFHWMSFCIAVSEWSLRRDNGSPSHGLGKAPQQTSSCSGFTFLKSNQPFTLAFQIQDSN